MSLRFQFCTHQRVCILYFLKKSQIRCTLMHSVKGHLRQEPFLGRKGPRDTVHGKLNGMPRDVACGLAWKMECPETLQVGLHGKQKTRKDKDIS